MTCSNLVFGSLTRISNLETTPFEIHPIPRNQWDTADYVVTEVLSRPGPFSRVELKTGRLVEVLQGDQILGALGDRAATLEATGEWRQINDMLLCDLLTPAGLFARETSHSGVLAPFPELRYLGHVKVGGRKVSMKDFAINGKRRKLKLPTIMVIGTSMSAGKTTAAKVVVRQLRGAGLKVIGAKLTGAGRYRDVLSMGDAGAEHIFDFVDMGLPSTVYPAAEYRTALEPLLGHLAGLKADVMVAEVGASPLEPYNGEVAMEALGDNIAFTILCASDPYAVAGLTAAFERKPDLVTGLCASTDAGIALVQKLTGLTAINILSPSSGAAVAGMLAQKLKLPQLAAL